MHAAIDLSPGDFEVCDAFLDHPHAALLTLPCLFLLPLTVCIAAALVIDACPTGYPSIVGAVAVESISHIAGLIQAAVEPQLYPALCIAANLIAAVMAENCVHRIISDTAVYAATTVPLGRALEVQLHRVLPRRVLAKS